MLKSKMKPALLGRRMSGVTKRPRPGNRPAGEFGREETCSVSPKPRDGSEPAGPDQFCPAVGHTRTTMSALSSSQKAMRRRNVFMRPGPAMRGHPGTARRRRLSRFAA